MITYEQVITRFEWWADAHPMIRSFTHGNLELADLDKEKNFPAVHVQALAFPIGVHTLTYRFEVYVFELHREDQGEAREIKVDLSDALQIFGDLVAEIRNGFEAFDREDFLLQYPIEPTPFIQEFNGVYTGVQGSLAIETAFLANACESPVNVADAPSQLCPVGTVTLNGVTFGTVASGGTLAGLVQYVNGSSVGSLVGSIWTIPNPVSADPVTITVNGSAYSTVASGGSDDIPVVDGDGAAVGTFSPGGNVVIADSAITVNATPYADLPATDALTIPVVNSAATQIGTVNAGTNVVIADMTLDYPDATTAALVIVPGSTVTVPPHWTIQLTGTVASPFTVVSPAWDSSFVCATETLTGGTISSITINGGAPIATFVGATIPASATIVVTFASSLTQVVLTF